MDESAGSTGGFDEGAALRKLVEIGIALSAERARDRLLERILIEAMALSQADGGTLYLRNDDQRLEFAIMRTLSTGAAFGGTTGRATGLAPLRLYLADGSENHRNVATHVALAGEPVNVPDAYVTSAFDFSGARDYDRRSGYRSQSFLTVPLKSIHNEVIGVLQLVNAIDRATGAIIPFATAAQGVVLALASQAAVALDNHQLLDGQKKLMEAFVHVIAQAIDAKSPYTGAHCQRVPVITEMLADAACSVRDGPFADFSLSPEERYELHIASWLHDCGKITTPEWVVDKATKLERVYDRIETIRTRVEILKRDAEIACLHQKIARPQQAATLETALRVEMAQLDDDFAFLERCNRGTERMPADDQARVRRIADRQWRDTKGQMRPLLDSDEADNLCIRYGTLLPQERAIVNNHIVMTIQMLEDLPFPRDLRHVPEYAGAHHERMDGKGYPRGLTREQMSVPARIMAIADIFEALTAGDRPYKPAKKLSETLAIMERMKASNHIDPDLYDLFIASGIYLDYAHRFLQPEQIDVGHSASHQVGPQADLTRIDPDTDTAL